MCCMKSNTGRDGMEAFGVAFVHGKGYCQQEKPESIEVVDIGGFPRGMFPTQKSGDVEMALSRPCRTSEMRFSHVPGQTLYDSTGRNLPDG